MFNVAHWRERRKAMFYGVFCRHLHTHTDTQASLPHKSLSICHFKWRIGFEYFMAFSRVSAYNPHKSFCLLAAGWRRREDREREREKRRGLFGILV
jgi:hypothetical protein